MMAWTFVNGALRDATTSLVKRASFLKERPISHIGLVATDVFKNVLLLLHLFPIYVGLEIMIRHVPNLYILQLVFTLPLLVVGIIPVCLIISFVSVRYRDFPPLINAVMNGLYFFTPIFWAPQQLGKHQWVIEVNPFASAVAMVRMPLRGELITLHDLLMVVAISLVGWLVMIPLHGRYRSRIVYWV
jgi:lipopolysaccharide transport system permease protein